MRRLTRLAITGLGAVVVGFAASSCGESTDTNGAFDQPRDTLAPIAADLPEATSSAPAATPPPASATPTRPAAPAQADTGEVFNVYWAWSIDTVASGTPERLAAGGRLSTATASPTAAMAALLIGVDEIEAEIGMGTAIPPATRLLGIEVNGGVATVDLSTEFNTSAGSLEETARFAQVVFTLTQFPDIDAVSFQIDGVDVNELGSHGFDVSAPVDRADFADLRAFITVERPFPGAVLNDGDHLSGESNTFEGTVEYVVTDADGAVIAEGFTTATDGNGNWGRFDTEISLEGDPTGLGAVIVFESSAQDGSQINIVEYPVTFGGQLPASL